MALAKALLMSGAARVVDSIGWQPGGPLLLEEGGRESLNTWKDDGLKGKVGDVAPWVDHLEYLVGSKAERLHLLRWFAFILQHPGRKCNHQLLFGGAPGIGKDSLIQPLIRGVGPSNVSQPGADQLGREFNGYLDRKKLVVFQEIHSYQRKDVENKIKPFAAAPPNTVAINIKGIREFEIPNLVSIVFMTNHRGDAMSIGEGDRRYFCVWSPAKPRPPQYYQDFYAWLDAGGDAAVVQHLMEQDLSGFNPGAPAPMTTWKEDSQVASVQPLEALLQELIEEERSPFDRDILTLREIAGAASMLASKQALLPGALFNLGCVHRKTKWRPPGPVGKPVGRGLWILRNAEDYEELSPTELGNKWLAQGGVL